MLDRPLHVWGLVGILCLLLLQGCASRVPPMPEGGRHAPDLSHGQAIVGTARGQLGVSYRRAGISPETGFDCSGLVWWVYKRHGVALPRTTNEQIGTGNRIRGPILPGDLLFFRLEGGRGRSDLHVGIATGQGTFIHSPRPGAKVREENIGDPYWSRRLSMVRRVL